MNRKHSIYLDEETQMLLDALVNNPKHMSNVSRIVQNALKFYAESLGYKVIPAKVVKEET